jgi:diguanylate cyclase (GGDEF)-like protein
MFIDVDNLKAVNDAEGHAAGDALLAGVGAALRSAIRDGDLALRYGGDEFVFALPGLSSLHAVTRLGEIRVELASTSPTARISCGSAQLQPEDSANTLIARADTAMYAARRSARRLSTRRQSR